MSALSLSAAALVSLALFAPVASATPTAADVLGAAASSAGAAAPESASTPVPLRFDVRGAAEVRTGIRGRVDIAGTFTGTFDPSAGTFTGGFALTPTRAQITVLGFLPVVAETDWSFTEPVTGTWQGGVLTMRVAARIRHPHLYAFGGVVIAGGANCATRKASVIELRSDGAAPIADLQAGGTLATSGQGFAISALSGCGVLDGLLSAVAAGRGNHATLELRPSAG